MGIFKYLRAVLTVLLVFGFTQTASAVVILTETFDGGVDNPGSWAQTSTGAGRISFSADPSSQSGDAMWMDSSTDGVFGLNEAILTVDLSSCSICWLTFYYAETGDETNSLANTFSGSVNGDGVSISDDGTNWYTILNAWHDNISSTWNLASIDLSAEALNAGMTLGANFQIKFQQYDNFSRVVDGRAYDEIVIESHIPVPGTLAILGLGLAGLGFARRKKS